MAEWGCVRLQPSALLSSARKRGGSSPRSQAAPGLSENRDLSLPGQHHEAGAMLASHGLFYFGVVQTEVDALPVVHEDLGQVSTVFQAFAKNLSRQILRDHLLYGHDTPCLLQVPSQDG